LIISSNPSATVGVGSVEELRIVVVVGTANRRGRGVGGAHSPWKQADAARLVALERRREFITFSMNRHL
jgi:hypothetical protein